MVINKITTETAEKSAGDNLNKMPYDWNFVARLKNSNDNDQTVWLADLYGDKITLFNFISIPCFFSTFSIPILFTGLES